MAKKKKWYAVRAGQKIGVFETWDECKLQVDGFKDAAFKAFDSHEDALLFLNCSQATAAVPQANHCSFSTAAGVASGPANVTQHELTGAISIGKRPRESDDLQLLQHSKSSLNSSATSPSDHTTSHRSPRCRPPAPRSNLAKHSAPATEMSYGDVEFDLFAAQISSPLFERTCAAALEASPAKEAVPVAAGAATFDAWLLQADCPSRGGAAPPPPNRDQPPHPTSSHPPERAAGGIGGEDVGAPPRRPHGLRGRKIGLWSVTQLCSSRYACITSPA
jgi:hypothetical protein